VLRDELAATVALAGELRLWTVLGSVHRRAAGLVRRQTYNHDQ